MHVSQTLSHFILSFLLKFINTHGKISVHKSEFKKDKMQGSCRIPTSRSRVAAILSENWGLTFFGIRQIRIQQPFPYLKIVYANFSAKMPTWLRNFVFPDLSITVVGESVCFLKGD